jgi:DNA-binding NarL/FixJ family response regulator
MQTFLAMKTFIVEDSPIIRDNLIATLEEMLPMRVMGHADSEAEAVSWLRDHDAEIGLVIIDLFLRVGSGLGVLRALQSNGASGRRVVLSNYATDDMRKQCLELGADRVFDKSHEIDALLDYCAEIAA